MTREEAAKILAAKYECMKREVSGTDLDCIYIACAECDLCYEQGTPGEQIEALEMAIKALEDPEPCDDAVSRESVSKWLKQYGQDVLHGKYKFSLMYIWKNLMDLPSTHPEIIRCRECKYAHLTYSGDCKYCDKWLDSDGFNVTLYLDGDFYCGYAERKNND